MLKGISRLASNIKDPVASNSKAAWGPVRAVVGVLIAFVGAQMIYQLILMVFVGLEGWSFEQTDSWLNSTSGQFISSLSMTLLSLALLLPFFTQFSKEQVLLGLGLTKPRLKVLGYALVGALVYFGIYIAVATIADQITPINVEQEQEVGFDSAKTTGNLLLAYISLAILPPIMEEIMFRGFLYGGLRKRFTVVGSSLITAAIFALPHASQSTDGTILWIAAIDTFILSLVLTYLREKTQSIYAGIVVHAIKNSIAFLFVFILAS